MPRNYTTYKLDEDTEELFSQMMNFAQRFIDLQMDDDVYGDLQRDLDELGERFNITRSDVEFHSETVEDPEAGETTVKITFKTAEEIPRVKKPEEVRKNLRLITNDDDDDPGTMH